MDGAGPLADASTRVVGAAVGRAHAVDMAAVVMAAAGMIAVGMIAIAWPAHECVAQGVQYAAIAHPTAGACTAATLTAGLGRLPECGIGVVDAHTGAPRVLPGPTARALGAGVATAMPDIPMRGDGAHHRHPRTLLTRGDAVIGAAFIGAALVVVPFDRDLAVESQDADLQSNRVLSRASATFRTLGDPGALLIGSAVYGFGRLTHRVRAADAGLHITEAVGFSGVATALIKGVAGRARPYVVGDTNPRDFALGRGFRRGSGFSAFPSGHTTVAFAAAAAATAEASRLWPGSARYVGPVLYASTTGVALSRMYNDKHWASDVLAGAAVGTITGRAVVRFQHAHPGNRVDRILLGTTVTPRRDGVGLRWSIPLSPAPPHAVEGQR